MSDGDRYTSSSTPGLLSKLLRPLAKDFSNSGMTGTYDVFEVDDDLKRQVDLPPDREWNPEDAPFYGMLYHGMAFHLAAKDILRWHRAGRAFARKTMEKLMQLPQDLEEAPEPLNDDNVYALGDYAVHTEEEEEAPISSSDYSTGYPISLRQVISTKDSNYSRKRFITRAKNADGGEFDDMNMKAIGAMTLIGEFYACIHLLLWNYEIPTHAEAILWRISVCTNAVSWGLWRCHVQ